jgi:cobalamin biosynthesis Mg chelatase CobN
VIVRVNVTRARRAVVLFVVAVACATAASLVAAPHASAATCWQRVIDDWRDGRITGTYSAACYRAALRNLPEDLRVYGSAEEDITRAMTSAVEQPTHRVLAATTTKTRAKQTPSPAVAKPARTTTRSLAGRAPSKASEATAVAAGEDNGGTSLAPARTAIAAGVMGLVALALAVALWRMRRRRASGAH